MSITAQNLADTFSVLDPDLNVNLAKVTPTLYQELDADFDGFAGHVLISMHDFSADWPTWERHPAGDEIVLLLSGSVTLVVQMGAAKQSIKLTEPGAYIVIPRNTWHTARVATPTRMLFITPGEGTENQEQPAGDI
jgi:mannose-6-phosphate isomerase-like protein (cupin superfamily)